MKCDVIDLANKKKGSINLDEDIFGLEVRKDLLARAVKWQLSRRQAGTHKTKERNEVKYAEQRKVAEAANAVKAKAKAKEESDRFSVVDASLPLEQLRQQLIEIVEPVLANFKSAV